MQGVASQLGKKEGVICVLFEMQMARPRRKIERQRKMEKKIDGEAEKKDGGKDGEPMKDDEAKTKDGEKNGEAKTKSGEKDGEAKKKDGEKDKSDIDDSDDATTLITNRHRKRRKK